MFVKELLLLIRQFSELVLCKLRYGRVEEARSLISSGLFNDHIRFLINDLDNKNELKMINNVQNNFIPHYRREYERRRRINVGKSLLFKCNKK